MPKTGTPDPDFAAATNFPKNFSFINIHMLPGSRRPPERRKNISREKEELFGIIANRKSNLDSKEETSMDKNHDRRKKITPAKHNRMRLLRQRGWVQVKIAKNLKCSQSTVSRLLRQPAPLATEPKTSKEMEDNENES
jgi:DNA invertase Pin-like site-specific DNA recombinase